MSFVECWITPCKLNYVDRPVSTYYYDILCLFIWSNSNLDNVESRLIADCGSFSQQTFTHDAGHGTRLHSGSPIWLASFWGSLLTIGSMTYQSRFAVSDWLLVPFPFSWLSRFFFNRPSSRWADRFRAAATPAHGFFRVSSQEQAQYGWFWHANRACRR